MKQTYSIAFYCRESKVSKKNGLSPLEMSLTINGKRLFINLPRKERPTTFKKQIDSKRGNDIKEFCNIYYTKANTAILELLREGSTLDVNIIKAKILGLAEKKKSVLEFWNEFMNHLTKRVDVDMQLTTFQKYLSAKEYFLSKVNKDMPIDDITEDMLNDMYISLKKEKSINTAEKYMTRIKSCFIFHKKTDVFDNIKLVKEKKEIKLFNDADYHRIKTTDFQYDSLNRMRDIFIFACSCGLSYSDIRDLKSDDLKIDVDGNITIAKKRVKTKVMYYSVVLKDGIDILKKYNFQLPKISNQKGNMLLHSIESICHTSAPLTFHKCRHYYCSRLIRAGVDATAVMRAMGHSSLKMTIGTYTHLVESDVKNSVLSKIN